MKPLNNMKQMWERPTAPPLPIVIFGAGSIVGDAHLPAYQKAGFPVAGIFDIDAETAKSVAAKWNTRAFKSLEEAVSVSPAVFDLATPPKAHAEILRALPDGAAVMMQKPMGTDLSNAEEILSICVEKSLTSAVNFQMRFAPMIMLLKGLTDQGLLGEITDAEVTVRIQTPWNMFPFLKALDRVEIAVHSIHYLDGLRFLIGDPEGVYAKTIRHPASSLKQTRTSAILDYGDRIRCSLAVNHNHNYGAPFEAADIKLEGTKGAAIAQIGVLMDYPAGRDDKLLVNTGSGWQDIPLLGNWFIDAFVGAMSNLQKVALGEDKALVSPVSDAIETMRLVEACYQSSKSGATPLPPGSTQGSLRR